MDAERESTWPAGQEDVTDFHSIAVLLKTVWNCNVKNSVQLIDI